MTVPTRSFTLPFMAACSEIVIPAESKELNNLNISVSRCRVVEANRFGRPTIEMVDEHTFQNFEEALKWSTESPGHMHSYEILLRGIKLSAELNGDKHSFNEKLTVSTPTRTGESPRSVNAHHGVSTDYENFFDIIIHLKNEQSTLFDRGVVWIKLGMNNKEANPTLKFNLNAGIHTSEELEEEISQMLQRVNQVTNDLLNGMPQPSDDNLF